MSDWKERIDLAPALGWKVVSKEFYNPGGTTYRDVLVDPDGNEHGFVDKYVKSRSLGRDVTILVRDPDAPAWGALLKSN